jgi:hypothetical protein
MYSALAHTKVTSINLIYYMFIVTYIVILYSGAERYSDRRCTYTVTTVVAHRTAINSQRYFNNVIVICRTRYTYLDRSGIIVV